MGTRFHQPIPQQFLQQSNPDRFGQPVSNAPFSQSQFSQQLSPGNNIQDSFRLNPSQSDLILKNQFFPSRNNGLQQDTYRDGSEVLNFDNFSPIKEKIENMYLN